MNGFTEVSSLELEQIEGGDLIRDSLIGYLIGKAIDVLIEKGIPTFIKNANNFDPQKDSFIGSNPWPEYPKY